MSANTKIEWADHTFNPWIGCTKVSPACDHCYAEADFAHRRKVVQWGAGQPRKRTAPSTWAQPLKWNREAERLGIRYRVFCASLADVFDNEVPAQWRADLLQLIDRTPHLDWLLLTKRIGNVWRMMLEVSQRCGGGEQPMPNVWIGATICNQEEADRDIPKLLAVPAAKRFLSIEPLLGPVDLAKACAHARWTDADGIECVAMPRHLDWVIVGGESGHGARPMHPDWARSLRDQCQAAGVPFLFKQWGGWCPRGPAEWGYPIVDGVPRFRMTDTGENGSDLGAGGDNHVWMNRAGKKTAGRLLDGREWNEVPA